MTSAMGPNSLLTVVRLSWLIVGLSCGQHIPATPQKVMVELTNDFGVCVLQLVHSRTENVAFSPYGLVSVALVLYEGTRGPTAAEIHATLKLPWNREVTRIGFRDLHRYLKSYFTNDGFLRGLVLSKPNVPLRQNYLRLLRFYGFYTNIMGASEQVTVTSSTTKQTTTTPVPPEEVPEERTTTETEAPTVLTTTTQLPTTTVVVPVTEPLEVTTTETVLTMTSAPGNIPEVMSQVNESALSSEGGTDHVVSIVPITGLEEKPDSTTETPAAVIGEETTLVTQISGEPTSTPNLAITEVKEQEAAPGSQQQVTATDDGETIGTPAHLAATTTPLPTSVLASQNPSASTAQESQEVTQSTAFISTEETTSSTLAVESISTMASATSAPSSQTAIFSEMSTIQQTGTSAPESYTSTLPTMPSPGVVEPENVPATVATSPTTGVTSGEPPMTEPSSTSTPAAVVVPQSETNTDPATGTPPENESTVPFSSSSPTTSQENVPDGATIAVGDSIDSGGEQEASHQEVNVGTPVSPMNILTTSESSTTDAQSAATTEESTAQTATSSLPLSSTAASQENVSDGTTTAEPSSTSTPAAAVVPQAETSTDPITGSPPENKSTPTASVSSSPPTTSQENLLDRTTTVVDDSIDTGGEQMASQQEVGTPVSPMNILTTSESSTTDAQTATSTIPPSSTAEEHIAAPDSQPEVVAATEPSPHPDMLATQPPTTESLTAASTRTERGITVNSSQDAVSQTDEREEGILSSTVDFGASTIGTSSEATPQEQESAASTVSTAQSSTVGLDPATETSGTRAITVTEQETSPVFKDIGSSEGLEHSTETSTSGIPDPEQRPGGTDRNSDTVTTVAVPSTGDTDSSLLSSTSSTPEEVDDILAQPSEVLFRRVPPVPKTAPSWSRRTRNPRSINTGNEGELDNAGLSSGVTNWIARGEQGGGSGGASWLPSASYHWFFTMSGAGESVPVLTYTAYLPFAHLPEVTSLALQIPLDDPRYAMLILLPEERMGLEEVLYSLQWCQLSNILSRLKTTPVYAVIPSFTTVKHVNLTPALAQLGVRRIFDPYRADLSEMATEPHVFVRTIEQVVTVSLRKYYHNHRWFDARPHEIRNHFIADHPFAYFVLDKETGVALMAGTIVNPITKQTDAT